ncbi:GntR family transcriptional regulator [Marinitenerispora sediminis]|uniref:GntR family transcriptional regulator n=1 Tax=Marinitenerispora sediminis TaxID=1931232 RepID=A0A368TBH7_9ACTN|nr:GntR family transcriptional regulator [Marinitenerispora sediminis]RCV48475.1 GntR family transcriptional regulator [Marinitenerispora sediminis]RCV50045.1 GntR family transcriptional regulator [Marinitenerispora sediminis]RCV62468.1 GntR family transcriptional regulator [Marinitenerispora sediminis]
MRQSTRVYQTLREEILDWRLAPGTVLTEVDIAERLAASRTPIREALARLVREGLVSSLPGRGLMVAEVSVDGVAQLFQMREALETYAARLAARGGDRRTFEDLHVRLREARDGMARRPEPADGFAGYYALIQEFDEAIDAASGNPYLRAALHDLRGHLVRLRRLARRSPARMLRAAGEHVDICAAIRDGDEDRAVRAVAAHLHNSLDNTLAALVEEVAGAALLGVAPAPRG